MDKLIARFPDQLEEAITIASGAKLEIKGDDIQSVFIAGMGGSGIGGEVVKSWIESICRIPVIIGKDYHLPGFINSKTLFVASSYSGNTEETLYAVREALERQAQILCITSGGKLEIIAQEENLSIIRIPSGWPAPRACLGYSVVSQIHALTKLGLIDDSFVRQLENVPAFLRNHRDAIKSKALQCSESLKGKIPVIYSAGRTEAVALRFRQQLNENSKTLCWHHTFPELNHNEIVGWSHKYMDMVVLILRDPEDFDRTKMRMHITESIITPLCNQIIHLDAKGSNQIQRCMYLIHLVDWISWYLCDIEKRDAMEIKWIDLLKSELSKSPF